MNLPIVRARLQARLDSLRSAVPVHVQVAEDAIEVHYGLVVTLPADTDWAGLLLGLAEIDVDQDEDVRWDEAVYLLSAFADAED